MSLKKILLDELPENIEDKIPKNTKISMVLSILTLDTHLDPQIEEKLNGKEKKI